MPKTSAAWRFSGGTAAFRVMLAHEANVKAKRMLAPNFSIENKRTE